MTECKLEKATETYAGNIKKLQEATAKKIHELTAYLQIEVNISCWYLLIWSAKVTVDLSCALLLIFLP